MPDPAEDVPADRHLGQGDGDLEFGALGPGVPRTRPIGAVVELADQLHRTVQGVEATIPVIADVHPPSTGRTVAVEDVEFPESEIGIRRPMVSHPAELPDHEPSVDSRGRFQRYVRKSRVSSPLPDRCFLMRGQSEANHAAIASGSRWRGTRRGFCGVNPRWRSQTVMYFGLIATPNSWRIR